jgi:CRP-like cAMP-binding protein
MAQSCSVLAVLEPLAEVTSYRRGQKIYAQNDPANHWYCVIVGMGRKCAITANGDRQIVDFLLPRDFFGFTARANHAFAVEAVVEGTVIVRYPRNRIEILADSHAELGRLIRLKAFEAISRSQMRMLLLSRATAHERVGLFLIEMADRLSGGAADAVALPMSRYDIADYLGLSVETVSRAMTALRYRKAIVLTGAHQVRILDRDTLEKGAMTYSKGTVGYGR